MPIAVFLVSPLFFSKYLCFNGCSYIVHLPATASSLNSQKVAKFIHSFFLRKKACNFATNFVSSKFFLCHSSTIFQPRTTIMPNQNAKIIKKAHENIFSCVFFVGLIFYISLRIKERREEILFMVNENFFEQLC